VKATKLLVTNLPGYIPKGLDGREAYPPPNAPLISVTGLRQAGRTEDRVELAWDAGRTGTRGYNVYLSAGDNFPGTKYFQKTTVCSKTSVKIDGLMPATRYAATISATNEDGIAGPTATVQAETASRPP
jgi:hypothetical protein